MEVSSLRAFKMGVDKTLVGYVEIKYAKSVCELVFTFNIIRRFPLELALRWSSRNCESIKV